MSAGKYVLITPARNEEAFIERTLQAVIAQTVLPKKWIIVSDGSTDRTDEIVSHYVAKYDFIQLVRITGHNQRTFSSKVNAFNAGYHPLRNMEYDYIGILDADVSFGPSYYEMILKKFLDNKKLGIAGGIRYDLCNGKFERVLCARNSVGGPFQLFRRKCYEDIGGFTPLAIGGEDAVAEIMARMHGWQVQSFPEIKVFHYRWTGTATGSVLVTKFREGIKNYLLGYHPLFQMVRSIYRVKEKPYGLSGLLLLSGYVWAFSQRYERAVSKDLVRYLRREQVATLMLLVFKA